MVQGFQVTIAIFLAGVIYAAGRMSARVEALETWRVALETKMDGIHGGIRRLEELVKNGRP
jgi:hypothetical protein